MYFFLRNFSFLEISFTTVCIPRFLGAIITRDKTISYNNCAAQLFFFVFMGVTEFYILTAMSYDRYVAICKPHEQEALHSACAVSLVGWISDRIPTPDVSAPAGLLFFQCHRSLCM
jgi:hypothetical protein